MEKHVLGEEIGLQAILKISKKQPIQLTMKDFFIAEIKLNLMNSVIWR